GAVTAKRHTQPTTKTRRRTSPSLVSSPCEATDEPRLDRERQPGVFKWPVHRQRLFGSPAIDSDVAGSEQVRNDAHVFSQDTHPFGEDAHMPIERIGVRKDMDASHLGAVVVGERQKCRDPRLEVPDGIRETLMEARVGVKLALLDLPRADVDHRLGHRSASFPEDREIDRTHERGQWPELAEPINAEPSGSVAIHGAVPLSLRDSREAVAVWNVSS